MDDKVEHEEREGGGERESVCVCVCVCLSLDVMFGYAMWTSRRRGLIESQTPPSRVEAEQKRF
jgi:hypothetical protein